MEDCEYCGKLVPNNHDYDNQHVECYTEWLRRRDSGLCMICGQDRDETKEWYCKKHDNTYDFQGFEDLWTQ